MYNIPELIRDPEFLARLRASLAEGSAPPVLRCVKIKLTSRCNLRCVMCKYWQTKSAEALPSERWVEVFKELKALGCRKLHFSGGEVFLRPDFLELVEAAAGLGMNVNLTTNGTLLTKDKARRLAKSAHAVSVSLDGPDARSHDEVRRRDGAFKKSVKAIRWLRDAGHKLRVRINFVLMRHNFRRLPAMVSLAGELGADDLIAMPVDEKGERKNRLSKGQIRTYNREVAPEVERLRRRYELPTDPAAVYPFGVTEDEIKCSSRGEYARGYFTRQPCLAPWLHLFLAWDGAAYLCCMTNGRMEPLGNVGLQPVREVFHGKPFRRVRRAFAAGRPLGQCGRCDLFLRENARLHAALEERGELRGAR